MDNSRTYNQSDRREVEVAIEDEQRSQEDRRGHFLNLVTSDEEFYNEMVNWLLQNGDDQWSIGPNENEAEDSKVTSRVRFGSLDKLLEFKFWLDDKSITH